MTIIEDILYPTSLLCGWSLIYRDNPFWRVFENLLVGMGTAYTLKIGIDVILKSQIIPISKGQIYPGIVGLILGIMVLTRIFKSTREFSYIPFGLMVGAGTAVGAVGAMKSQILGQTVVAPFVGGTAWENFSNFMIFFSTLTTLSYFIFITRGGTISGPFFRGLRFLGKIGRYLMMAGFGVTIGNFYISTGVSMVVYWQYLSSPVGRWITLIGIIILAASIYQSLKERLREEEVPAK